MKFESTQGNFKKDKYGYLMVDTGFKEKYTYYKKNKSALTSFRAWIGENEWNEVSFIQEIKYKYFPKNLSFAQEFLLSDFWGLNEDIIEKGLTECVELSYDGKLTLDEYITMLNYTVTLVNMKYEIPYEMDYKKMILGLDKKKDLIIHSNYKEPKKRTYIDNERLKVLGKDAIELNKQIEMFNDKIVAWDERKKLFIL